MKIIKDIYHLSRHLILSKTAISTYVIFSGNITSAFLAFLFTVILVRKLSFADFGYFSALFSLVLLVSDLADIGIGSSLSAFLPPLQKTKEIMFKFLKSAFLLQLAIVSVVTLILIIFSSQLSSILFHTDLLTNLLNITALCIFCTVLANFSLYALSARQKFFHAAFLSFYSSFVRLLVLLILIFFSAVNLNNVVVFQFFGLFTYFIVAIIFLNPSFIRAKIDINQMKNLISFTYLLGLARGLTALASRLDVLMLVALRGPTEAGIYAIAARIIQIFPLLSGSFATVVAPKLSSFKEHSEVKKFISKVILFTSIMILGIIIMTIFADTFMQILFSDKGRLSSSVFQLLLVSMIFFVGSIPAVTLAVYYLKKPHILTLNAVLQLIIVLAGNFYFIPIYGRFGAAYSLIIAYSLTLFLTSALTYYYFRRKHA